MMVERWHNSVLTGITWFAMHMVSNLPNSLSIPSLTTSINGDPCTVWSVMVDPIKFSRNLLTSSGPSLFLIISLKPITNIKIRQRIAMGPPGAGPIPS